MQDSVQVLDLYSWLHDQAQLVSHTGGIHEWHVTAFSAFWPAKSLIVPALLLDSAKSNIVSVPKGASSSVNTNIPAAAISCTSVSRLVDLAHRLPSHSNIAVSPAKHAQLRVAAVQTRLHVCAAVPGSIHLLTEPVFCYLPLVLCSSLKEALTMSSAPNASSSGKALNTPSSHPPLQPATSPSFESSSRRSGSYSNNPVASSRNNQGQRKQHKNSKKPRLADEDAMAEAVSKPISIRLAVLTAIGSHQEPKQS